MGQIAMPGLERFPASSGALAHQVQAGAIVRSSTMEILLPGCTSSPPAGWQRTTHTSWVMHAMVGQALPMACSAE